MRADDGRFTTGFKDGFEFVLGGANRFFIGGVLGIVCAILVIAGSLVALIVGIATVA